MVFLTDYQGSYFDVSLYREPTVLKAGMHFDTFSLYFRTLRADISAPVNPRGLQSTLLESEGSSYSLEADFNPSTLRGRKIKFQRENKKYRSACQPIKHVY